MSEEAKKRILERYSKATILEAYLMLSEKYSFVAGKTVADVFNENLLAAEITGYTEENVRKTRERVLNKILDQKSHNLYSL